MLHTTTQILFSFLTPLSVSFSRSFLSTCSTKIASSCCECKWALTLVWFNSRYIERTLYDELLRLPEIWGYWKMRESWKWYIAWFLSLRILFRLDFRQMSAQTVFSALDYLNRWTRARAHSLAIKTQLLSSRNRTGGSVTGDDLILSSFFAYVNQRSVGLETFCDVYQQ